MTGISPFAGQVRAHAHERYLATLFAPEGKRPDLFILYAFDAEIRRIADVVKEPGMGEIRLQWWREILEGKRDGEAAGHPLAAAMLDVVRRHSLPASAFGPYLDAASFAFYHDAFADRYSFEAWAGALYSSVMQMAAVILDPAAAALGSGASGHAGGGGGGGVVQSVADVLRRLPGLRARGQCLVPQDILNACGLTIDTFISGKDDVALKCATDAFAALGQEHFSNFHAELGKVPIEVKPSTLPAFAANRVLTKAISPAHHPAMRGVPVLALATFWSIFRAGW